MIERALGGCDQNQIKVYCVIIYEILTRAELSQKLF